MRKCHDKPCDRDSGTKKIQQATRSNSGHLSSFLSVVPSVSGLITTRAARFCHICLQYLSYREDPQQESLTFLFHPSL